LAELLEELQKALDEGVDDMEGVLELFGRCVEGAVVGIVGVVVIIGRSGFVRAVVGGRGGIISGD